jgi:hypothetical protein
MNSVVLCRELIKALSPKKIVQIGIGDGAVTSLLAELSRSGDVKTTTIDAWPNAHVEKEVSTLNNPNFEFLKLLLLDALPHVFGADVLIFDDQSDYFTVSSFLESFETNRAKGEFERIPFVVMANVGWPLSCRDFYHDPTTVPETFRSPFDRDGIEYCRGLSQIRLYEGCAISAPDSDTKAGALTAVEDFVATRGDWFAWNRLAVPYGIGLLFERRLLSQDRLRSLLDGLEVSEVVSRISKELGQGIVEPWDVSTTSTEIVQIQSPTLKADEDAQRIKYLEETVEEKLREEDTLRSELAQAELVNSSLTGELSALNEGNTSLQGENREQAKLIRKLRTKLSERIRDLDLATERMENLAKTQIDQVVKARGLEDRLVELRIRLGEADAKTLSCGKAARHLEYWLLECMILHEAAFRSWTWRIGSAVLSPLRLILRKKRIQVLRRRFLILRKEYRSWKSTHFDY